MYILNGTKVELNSIFVIITRLVIGSVTVCGLVLDRCLLTQSVKLRL